jgi:hypothetical protein
MEQGPHLTQWVTPGVSMLCRNLAALLRPCFLSMRTALTAAYTARQAANSHVRTASNGGSLGMLSCTS